MLADPDVRGPLTALRWVARLDGTGPLAACVVCHRSSAWRVPSAAPGGRDLGLHPACIPAGLESEALTDDDQAAAPQPVVAPTAPKGAYARRWSKVA